METKIRLRPKKVGKSYPVTYKADFTSPPKRNEITLKKNKVERVINDDRREQVRKKTASSKHALVFKWKRVSQKPLLYTVLVNTKRIKKSKDGNGGGGVPPTPMIPTPPPM